METWAGAALLLLFVVPVSVYLSVKLGTVGYLRAKELFKQGRED